MAKEFDIFNLSVDDIDSFKRSESKGSDLYKPTADQGKDGVYTSLIRFLPNPKNPQKSIIRKFVYWLEDAEGKGAYYDSPSTVGEKCPVQDLFFKLRNSESAVDKKMAEKLKRREIYYSLIQVIKDPQSPEMEGQVKVFKYGYQIKQKIDEELNPQFDEPCQVFDLFDGKNFELKVTKSAGYNSFTASKFQGKKTAVIIGGSVMENSKDDRTKIMEYLKEVPELDSFDFKPWDDSTRNSVERILDNYRSPGSAIGNVSKGRKEETSYSTLDNDLNFDDAPKKSTPASKPAPAVESSTDEGDGDGDDLNDFLKGLDL
jgi:hypothetical protein